MIVAQRNTEFSADENEMDFDEKLQTTPAGWKNDRALFFKYMTADTAKIVLRNRTLRWSGPALLNDPYDIQFDLRFDIDRKRVRSLQIEKMWRVFSGEVPDKNLNAVGKLMKEAGRLTGKQMSKRQFIREFAPAIDEGYDRVVAKLPETQREVQKHMSRSKILCLTEDPVNTVMWTHYAAGHTGAVLVFRSIPMLDSCFGMAEPISYKEDLPKLLSEEEMSDLGAGLWRIDVEEQIRKLVFTKGAAWLYEKEWRIFSGDGREPDAGFEDIPFHELELSGVVFGIKTSPEDRAELSELTAAYSNAVVHTVRKSTDGFNHVIVPQIAA